jgi:hypothetical protein
MPLTRKCKRCNGLFTTKLFFIQKGQGMFCSRACSYASMRTGTSVVCAVCKKGIYKTETQLKRSSSKKYFCNKSCQTKWRNKEFSGEKHKNWAGGFSTYRDVLTRNGAVPMCSACGMQDARVLAAHHIDKNHKNNDIKNLQWLCHNCHYHAHHVATPANLKKRN